MYAQCIAHNIAGLRLFLPKLHTGIRSLGYLEAIGNKNLKRDTPSLNVCPEEKRMVKRERKRKKKKKGKKKKKNH